MTRFVVGDDRNQSTLFPERLDEYLADDNPVRAIDVFADELDLWEGPRQTTQRRCTQRQLTGNWEKALMECSSHGWVVYEEIDKGGGS